MRYKPLPRDLLFSILLILILSGCRSADPLVLETPSSGTELRYEEVYDKHSLLQIDIQMDEGLFDQMADESRLSPYPLSHDELVEKALALVESNETPPNYYNWYPAKVIIEGESFSPVGIRKKGLIGSYSYPVPGLKLQLDYYSSGNQYKGVTSLTLNNAASDKTRMRTCLTYELFAAAGYPAPLCNLARVSLNGEPLDIYVHVEPIKEPFLLRNFGKDAGSLYEGAGETDLVVKDLPRFLAKTNLTDPSKTPLINLMEALDSPDEILVQQLSDHLNIDKFIRYWALEMVSGHMDGYSTNNNNFYIYFDPQDDDRAVFIPWGADLSFFPQDRSLIFTFFHYLIARLPARLADDPAIKQQMIDEVHFILENVWNEDAILESINHYEQLIKENRSYIRWDISDLTNHLREYVKGHPAWVLERLEPMFELPRAKPRLQGMDPPDDDQALDYVVTVTADKILAMLDVDRDGCITMDEMPAENRSSFTNFDADQDGKIDLQEAQPIADYFNTNFTETSVGEKALLHLLSRRTDLMVIVLSLIMLITMKAFRRKF